MIYVITSIVTTVVKLDCHTRPGCRLCKREAIPIVQVLCYARHSREFRSLFKCQKAEETAVFSCGYHCFQVVSMLTCTHCFAALQLSGNPCLVKMQLALRKPSESHCSTLLVEKDYPDAWLMSRFGPKNFFSHLRRFHSLPSHCNNLLLFLTYVMDVIVLSK